MKNYFIKSIELYQKYLSRDHAFWAKDNVPYCRYTPSCSEYTKEAIEKRGVIVWGLKWIGRICRCMPWSKWGYDPVEKKEWATKS